MSDLIQGFFSKITKKSKKNNQPKKSKTTKKKTIKKKNKPSTKRTKIKTVIQVHGPNDKLKEVYTKEDVLAYELPLIRNYANDTEKRKLSVTRKLRLCSVIYNFGELLQAQNEAIINHQNHEHNNNNNNNNEQTNSTLYIENDEYREKELRGIENKRQMLVEIVEFISTQQWWDEKILQELIKCMNCNLFRTLPTKGDRKVVKGDEEEEPFQDPSWIHLQLIYELCLRFLIANDINKKIMQKYLYGNFVLNLIQLFQSEDHRERDYLKTILHRIYGRFMPLRLQIRTSIADECYRYIYSYSREVYGIAEFLDIFSSIINGFSVPVKDEHKAFLRNVLIPLHKCDKYDTYFQQLADCCVLFVNKEQNIAATVLGGLLKFWPHSSPTKEAFYLREMLNVIGALVEHENGFSYSKHKDILLLCINQIFICMISPHFQVAEQAMTLWKDTVMLYLSKCEKDVIWRRLFIIFKKNYKSHWNPGIKVLTTEVIQYYERIDSQYWKLLQIEYENSIKNKSDDDQQLTNGDENDIISKPKTLNPNVFERNLYSKQIKKSELRCSQWGIIREVAESQEYNFVSGMSVEFEFGGKEPNPNIFLDDQKSDIVGSGDVNKSVSNGHHNSNVVKVVVDDGNIKDEQKNK